MYELWGEYMVIIFSGKGKRWEFGLWTLDFGLWTLDFGCVTKEF